MQFKKILSGNISKHELGYIYFTILFCIVILWAIARALYPEEGGYLINIFRISRQGNYLLNPVGAWFFIIGTAIASILLIPFFMFIYQKLKPTLLIVNVLMAFSGIVGAFGLMMVGIFPEDGNDIFIELHSIGSTVAFSGLGVCTFFSIIIMLVRIIQKQPWPTLAQYANLFFIILFFGLAFLVTDDSVNQWTGFYIIFVWCAGMFFILPEDPKRKEPEMKTEI
jgi:hypothetical protein